MLQLQHPPNLLDPKPRQVTGVWADSHPPDDLNHLRLLRQAKKHAQQRRNHQGGGTDSQGHEYDEAKVIKRVLDGDLQLIDVTAEEKELLRAPPNSYAGVYGKFCRLDWSRRKVDPSAGTCVVVVVTGS